MTVDGRTVGSIGPGLLILLGVALDDGEEEARYISCRKGFEGRIPRTTYSLTNSGRDALNRYLDHMETIIER